jgi:hypothetical protein
VPGVAANRPRRVALSLEQGDKPRESAICGVDIGGVIGQHGVENASRNKGFRGDNAALIVLGEVLDWVAGGAGK